MSDFEKALDKRTDNFAQDMARAAYRDGARWYREWCEENGLASGMFGKLAVKMHNENNRLRTENAKLETRYSTRRDAAIRLGCEVEKLESQVVKLRGALENYQCTNCTDKLLPCYEYISCKALKETGGDDAK